MTRSLDEVDLGIGIAHQPRDVVKPLGIRGDGLGHVHLHRCLKLNDPYSTPISPRGVVLRKLGNAVDDAAGRSLPIEHRRRPAQNLHALQRKGLDHRPVLT